MACITLPSQINWVFTQIKRTVFQKVWQKVNKMFGCIRSVINNFSSIIDWESNPDWLIRAKQMAKMVPIPYALNGLIDSIWIDDVYRADLIKASELTGSSRSSLKPDNERYSMILPAEIIPLPQWVINWSGLVLEIPINILITWVWLSWHCRVEFFIKESCCVFKTGR